MQQEELYNGKKPEYGVDAYKVLYTMPYMDEDIEVSGAMFIPTRAG